MPQADCPHCGKKVDGFDFDLPDGCKKPAVFGICVGEWRCKFDPKEPQPESQPTTKFESPRGSLIRFQ